MYGQTLSKIQPYLRSNMVQKYNLIYGETLSKNTTSFTVKHGQKYDLINFTVKHGQKYNLINFTVKVTVVFSLTFYYGVTNAFMKTQLYDWKGNSSPVLIDAFHTLSTNQRVQTALYIPRARFKGQTSEGKNSIGTEDGHWHTLIYTFQIRKYLQHVIKCLLL